MCARLSTAPRLRLSLRLQLCHRHLRHQRAEGVQAENLDALTAKSCARQALPRQVPVWLLMLVPVCFWSAFSNWLQRQRRLKKPPTFVPFPKSLLWPTPLFFTCAVFVTGLTRAAVKVLAEPAQ